MSLRLLYSAGFNGSFELSMEESLNAFFEFRKSNNTLLKRDFKVLRYREALLFIMLRLEGRKTFLDFMKQLIQLKSTYPWLKKVNSQSLQGTISHLDNAYQRFYKIKFRRFFLSDSITVNTYSKEVVVYESYRTKVFDKKDFLFFGWVESIFKGFKHNALKYFSLDLVKYKYIKESIDLKIVDKQENLIHE